MASPTTTQKHLSRVKYEMWDHDPDGTSAAIVTPDAGTTEQIFDLSGYSGFVCGAMSSTLTGNGITKLEIVASETSDFSGETIVIKDSGTVAADAVGDWVILECTADEVKQEGLDNSTPVAARYVAGRLTVANAADEAVVFYAGVEPRFASNNLTPATTIA